MKVTGILDFDPYAKLSLAEIIRREKSDQTIKQIIEEGTEQVQVSSFDELPEEIKKDLLRQKEREQRKNQSTKNDPTRTNPAQQPVDTMNQQPIDDDPETTIEATTDQQRIIEFKSTDHGFTVLLPPINSSKKITEKLLLKNHGQVYRTHLDRYALGLFEKRRRAKQYSASLKNIYNGLDVRPVKSGYVIKN